jgi:hypothetical protein
MPDPIRTTIIDAVGDRLAPTDIDALAREIGGLLRLERLRCARLCRDRADLWRNTALAKSAIPQAREEARARANEAAYLADAIELAV